MRKVLTRDGAIPEKYPFMALEDRTANLPLRCARYSDLDPASFLVVGYANNVYLGISEILFCQSMTKMQSLPLHSSSYASVGDNALI